MSTTITDAININEVMNLQPTINIGMIGHVSNGKTSITGKLTGKKTQQHSEELKKNITIKLGYANAKIFKCSTCPRPSCYQSHPSDTFDPPCDQCQGHMDLIKHISIVDSPGHQFLMATMLNGTCVMDSAILVEAVNNVPIPAPQTEGHLIAASIAKLRTKIVCMNKMDLVKKEVGTDRILKFREYLSTKFGYDPNNPIIPVIANYGINMDVLCEYICTNIDEPKRDLESDVKMFVIRSFNVNKPNIPISSLVGGVVGGTIMKGVLRIGDNVQILPGTLKETSGGDTKWSYSPLISNVVSILSEKNKLQLSVPGGLIAVGLNIDPGLAGKDGLVGSVLRTSSDQGQNQGSTVDDKFKVLERLFVNAELIDGLQISKNEIIVINCNACNSKCKVLRIKGPKMDLELIDKPICVDYDDYVTISKIVGSSIKVLCRGKIVGGTECQLIAE